MRVPANFLVLAIAAAVSLFAAKTKEPVYVDPAFRFGDVDTVYILPAVDLRVNKEQNSEKHMLTVDWSGRYFLKQRGYRTVPEGCCSKKDPTADKAYAIFMKQHDEEAKGMRQSSARMEVAEDDLKEPQELWIRRLGPNDARWVLILALEDSASRMTFGSTGSAIVMGTLFDKQNGKLVWRAIGTARSGQGGLIGMAIKSEMADIAIQDAIVNLYSMVDKRGGKKK